MAEHTTEYADALMDPERFRLIAVLADGPRTLESLASELDTSEATILKHAATLERLDVVRSKDHVDGTRMYELRREPVMWDSDWASLPLPVKRSLAAANVTNVAAMASAAVDRGGFDRDDMHLTRTTIRVDEERWRELSKLLGGTLHSLGDLAEAPEPDGSTFHATAVLMLFTGEEADVDAPIPSERREDEALQRMWDLGEELDAIGSGAVTDWPRIQAIAEELRLIAGSMRTVPTPSVAPHG